MGKRTYSDTEKATTLAMLDANGGNLSRTQRETSVPRTTLREWRDGRHNGEVADIRREKKLELSALIEEKARLMLGGITEEKIAKTGAKDLMTGVGIAADKMLALRDQGQQPSQERVNIFIQMNQEVKDTPGFPRR